MKSDKAILFERPGGKSMRLTHLLLDYNGTLALDGELLDRVSGMLHELSERINIVVLTSDTFGTAKEKLGNLPVELRIVEGGWMKKQFILSLAGQGVVAVGNGNNDIEMFRQAELSIAVNGPEGAASELLLAAHIVVNRIEDALGLLMNPKRLTATLRA